MADMWCVEVSYCDDDPDKFGPYTERQARRVAAQLVAEVKAATDSAGRNRHPGDVTYAVAVPLIRYDNFLTAAEKRALRHEINGSAAQGGESRG